MHEGPLCGDPQPPSRRACSDHLKERRQTECHGNRTSTFQTMVMLFKKNRRTGLGTPSKELQLRTGLVSACLIFEKGPKKTRVLQIFTWRSRVLTTSFCLYTHPGVDGMLSLSEPLHAPYMAHILSTSGWLYLEACQNRSDSI